MCYVHRNKKKKDDLLEMTTYNERQPEKGDTIIREDHLIGKTTYTEILSARKDHSLENTTCNENSLG